MDKLKFLLKPLLIFFGLLLITFPVVKNILRPGYYPMHDDIQGMRVLELDKCVKDGQIPCRWVPDMGYGYGYPQFNYYGPLPYYLMEGFHLSGLGYLASVKAGLVLLTLISVIGMFLLGKSLWGTGGGFVSAIIYAYAPYRALDFYVRGDISELAALAVFPYIFWSIREILKGNKKHVLWLAISVGALLSSHNISTLIFLPIAAIWALFLVLTNKKEILPKLRERIIWLALGGIWGLTLGAFFVLPAWFEKSYAHTETLLLGYFNYLAHFVTINQILFSTYWNYGSSELGPWDELYLGIGLLLWILPLISLILLYILRKRDVWFPKKEFKTVLFFVVIGWIALFLTHEKSTFIWNHIPIFAYLQFPWRFLIIATFMFSLAAGSLTTIFLQKKQKVILTLVILFSAIFLYSGYFVPQKWLNITDSDKFSGSSWISQQTISIFDYLPIYAKHPPAAQAPGQPVFVAGKGKVLGGTTGTDWQNWNVMVLDKSAKIQLSLYYFPGWRVTIDGTDTKIDYNNELGLITVEVATGGHMVSAELINTPVRNVANILTLLGLLSIPFAVYILWKR